MIDWLRRHGYAVGLTVAGLLAAAVRLTNILIWRPTCPGDLMQYVETGQNAPQTTEQCWAVAGDAAYGYVQGQMIARGDWFIDSATWVGSHGTRLRPSAGDPPLYALYLAFWSKLGLSSVTSARLVSALAGVAGVVLIGMVARRVAGTRAGVIAALLAAFAPMLWINDGMLLSEALYVPMVALAMLAGYHFWQKPSMRSAVLMGVVISLAALTRAESLVLFGFMVIPLAWGLKQLTLGRRALLAVVSGLAGLVVIAPWFIYNASRFEKPVFMTSGTGAVLLAGSCDPAFEGEYIGYYGANCYTEYVRYRYMVGDPRFPGCDEDSVAVAWSDHLDHLSDAESEQLGHCYPDPLANDESEWDAYSREFATRYIREHKSQIPLVMAARVGRMWDLYAPGQNVRLNYQVEGRGEAASWAGLLAYYAQIPFAIAGLVLLVRRRIPVSPLLGLAAIITVTAAITFGVTRYRVPADVMIAILAAVGIEWLVARRWPATDTGTITRRRMRRSGGDGGSEPTDDPTEPGPDLQPPPELTHV